MPAFASGWIYRWKISTTDIKRHFIDEKNSISAANFFPPARTREIFAHVLVQSATCNQKGIANCHVGVLVIGVQLDGLRSPAGFRACKRATGGRFVVNHDDNSVQIHFQSKLEMPAMLVMMIRRRDCRPAIPDVSVVTEKLLQFQLDATDYRQRRREITKLNF